MPDALDATAWRLPRQTGSWRLDAFIASGPHTVALPLFGRKTGAGPRVLVVGGTHGDEFEGQLAAAGLARDLERLEMAGALCVMPRHNPPACVAGSRCSPIDGLDLNRCYPGPEDPGAAGLAPSEAVAAFVTHRLLPEFDWLIDLHSGGKSHEFVLSSNLQARVGSDEDRRLRPALAAFGAPYAIIFDETGADAMPHTGTLEGAARERGLSAISSELGGAGRLTRASARAAVEGLANLLAHIGVLSPRHAAAPAPLPRYLRLDDARHYVNSPVDGLLEPMVELGQNVRAEDVLGVVYPAEDISASGIELKVGRSGTVVATAATGLVDSGELAFAVAEPC
jgi:predicted deacylase